MDTQNERKRERGGLVIYSVLGFYEGVRYARFRWWYHKQESGFFCHHSCDWKCARSETLEVPGLFVSFVEENVEIERGLL
jgi:hypothetical protein